MIRRAALPAVLLALPWPAPLLAHDLGPAETPMRAFATGLILPLNYVEALLPLLVLGLALAGQRQRPWAWALGGLGAGLLLAPWLGDLATLLALGAGCLTGIIVALKGLPLPAPLAGALTALLTGTVTAALFHGGAAPVMMELGSVVSGVAVVALACGGAILVRRLPFAWTGIALRVAASWLAALLMILVAFVLAMPAPPPVAG